MRKLLSLIGLLLLTASPSWGAALSHTCITPVTTEDTHTGDTTWTDVTGASIGSGSFTTGRKYLLLGSLNLSETGTGVGGSRMMHGSTAFTESEWYVLEFSDQRMSTSFFDLWTAVASEGVKWQHRINNGANTVGSDQVTLCAFDFEDLSATADYRYNENASTTGLTTTYAAFATLTFTPSTTEKWAVLWSCNITLTTTDPYKCRVNQSGISTTPEARIDSDIATLTAGLAGGKIVTLTASTSYTFSVEAASETSNAHNHADSRIMLIRCGVFDKCDGVHSDSQQSLSTTDFATELATVSVTPSVTTDALVCGWARYEIPGNQYMNFRVQHGTTDIPATQTSDVYDFTHQVRSDTSNRVPLLNCSLVSSLGASSQTFAVDGSISSGTGNASHAGIFVFTTELAASGIGSGHFRRRFSALWEWVTSLFGPEEVYAY